MTGQNEYTTMIQDVKIPSWMDRFELHELGKRGPYHRYVSFPVRVSDETLTDPEGVQPDFVVENEERENG